MSLHNESRDGYSESTRALECVRSALRNKLFPESVELLVDSKKVQLKREGQDAFSFQDLSDGYRSMLSLSVDLLRWLTKAFPNEPEVMKCSGVMLIDELDNHLHPKWQREIGFWLREKFPNIQFIVGTHSPFLAQVADEDPSDPLSAAAGASLNIRLIQTEKGVVAVHSQENARVLSPEQILQGDLFSMESVLSPPVEHKRQRFTELSRKQGEAELNAEEQEEMRQLSFELDQLPIGSTADERVKEEALRGAVGEAKAKIQELK